MTDDKEDTSSMPQALLLIAEADAGVAREAMAPVDISSVARDVGELYGPLADEKGIALSVVANRPVSINGNRSLISQALANLVDNAIKYSGEGGRVAIETSESGASATLTVSDMGPGIPVCERAHVVERFVRLEASRHSPGTGLGLSLVAAVARLHDAQFALDDNMPGLKAILSFRIRAARSGQH